MIETTTATAPACWAPYLINGDASGLRDDYQAQCDAWCARLARDGWRVVSTEGEAYYAWRNDATGSSFGGDILPYILQKVTNGS